ncbi:hypothetical protein [Streptomyces megasporus]|uniref:hypothetical protein n=1 Tax=Streptomyces megasporus TaxID=44060 RepID=UPI0004E25CD5|nr:hypothetical protein [Streptomyces megasporus]
MTGHPEREALLIAGRSGVGKSTVGQEVSALSRDAGVAHCLIEGDVLDHVHPAPPGDPHRSAITERNLTALWAGYAALGHRRLIYTNTVSVLEGEMFERVMGAPLRLVRVLLTADDATARARLTVRETGSRLDAHIRRGALMARRLAEQAPPDTVRVPTDGRSVPDIAREVLAFTGW